MRTKDLELVHYIVDSGVHAGWTEVHDDIMDPSDDQILEAIIQAVMDQFNHFYQLDSDDVEEY